MKKNILIAAIPTGIGSLLLSLLLVAMAASGVKTANIVSVTLDLNQELESGLDTLQIAAWGGALSTALMGFWVWLLTVRRAHGGASLDQLVSLADQGALLAMQADPYRVAVQRHPVPMLVYDRESLRVLDANYSALEKLGYSQQEITAFTFLDLHVPEQRYLSADAAHNLPGSHWKMGLRSIVRSDGDAIEMDLYAYDFVFFSRPARLVSLLDVTEMTEAQERLHSANEALQTLIDAAPLAIVQSDAEGRVLIWNRAAEKIFGTSARDAIGGELPEPSRLGMVARKTLLDESQDGRQALGMEMEWVRPDGEQVILNLFTTPVMDLSGDINSTVMIAEDITERTQTAETLLLAQHSIQEGPLATFWIRQDGRIVLANAAASQLLGYSLDELLQMSVPDIDLDVTREKWDQNWKKIKALGTYTLESRHRAKDGRILPVEINVAFLEHQGQEYHFAFFTDISDRKSAQAALKQSEARYRALYEQANVGILAMDNSIIISCNQRAAEMVGYPREKLAGKSVLDISPANQSDGTPSKEKAQSYMDRAYSGKPVKFEWRHVKLDGSFVDFEITLSMIHLDGKPVLTAMWRDVTERKRAEQALRESESFANKILAASQNGLYIYDPGKGAITFINPRYTELTGYTLDDLNAMTGDEFLSHFHPEDLPRVLAHIESALRVEDGQTLEIEYRFRRADGVWIWAYSLETVFSRNPDGSLHQYIGTFLDITERKAAEEAIRRSEERLAQAEEIAHLGGWESEISNREELNANPLHWTAETFRIFGYEPWSVEVTNELFFSHILPDDRELVERAVAQAIEQHRPYRLEHRIRRADGAVRIVLERGEVAYDPQGNASRILGVVQDITERKQAEDEMN